MQKLERMRWQLGDTVYDVIGTLLEGVRLEELIMRAALAKEEPEFDRILDLDAEKRIDEFRRALEENALAGHHIDLSSVQKHAADSLLHRLVPWDVQRFTCLAVQTIGGQVTEDKVHPKVFRISVPRQFLKQHGLQNEAFARGIRVAFERAVAREKNAEYLAPGHPLLEALIDRFLLLNRPAMAVLLDEQGRDGTLWLYRIRLQDGRNETAFERLIALFYDRTTGETREVDPRMLWELETMPHDIPIPALQVSALPEASQATRKHALKRLEAFRQEAQARRSRECNIKKRWLEVSYKELIRESQEKLYEYHRRKDAGEDMHAAIRQEEDHLKSLLREQQERLTELEKEHQLTKVEPELEAVVLILPKAAAEQHPFIENEAAKRQVEEAGIKVALEFERHQGRDPTDVSREFFGYDIVSTSPTDTRYIEVKAFASTGKLELTLHEWQMAERLQDAYWLYVIENALDAPQLHCIQNPARHLHAQPVTGIVKIVIERWKNKS